MINVATERRENLHALHVWGEAGCTIQGCDAVHAAVTALVQTLAGMVLLCNPPCRDIRLGNINSRIVVTGSTSPVIDIAFTQIVLGLQLIAKQHPNIIKVQTNGYLTQG